MSRGAAQERYRQLRRRAFEAAEDRLRGVPGLSGLDFELFQATDRPLSVQQDYIPNWVPHGGRKVQWDWMRILDRFGPAADPAAFTLAVSSGSKLCALAAGRPSRSRSHMALHFVEGAPGPAHPLRGFVLPIVLEAIAAYAVVLGAQEMRVIEPLPALIPLYVDRFGFVLEREPGGAHYLRRKVGP